MFDLMQQLGQPELDQIALSNSIAEFSPLPMAAFKGGDHNVVYVNPAFCQLLNKTKEEIAGKPFALVAPPGEECLSLLERVYETGQAQLHTGLEDLNHSSPYWSYAMWPIRIKGDIAGIIMQVTESTSLHRLATALNQALLVGSIRQHELADHAEQLNNKLLRSNEDLKQFAFAASHDLKEPLRNITIFSQLLIGSCRDSLGNDAEYYGDCIVQGVKRMQNLLVDLLSYVQADADDVGGHEVVDLNRVLELSKQNLEMAIIESSAIVTSNQLPSIPGNFVHFVQLFQNLLGNAIKYRGKQQPRIHISAEERNETWHFAICDNGIGIAAEYHQKIFGLFKRLHGQQISGSGLGLSICRRIVDRYHGSIWVESQAGQGATFHFTLASAVVDPPAIQPLV